MLLIFDFDGTLVDSFEKIIEKFNQIAGELNYKQITHEEAMRLKDLSSKELVKYLKIPIYKIPKILLKIREQMHNEISGLSIYPNLSQVLQKMHEKNFSLGILTSNSEENVTSWLDLNKMHYMFDFVHIESNFFGKHRVLKAILKKYKINKTNAFYIGDETRDIDAAKHNGIYSIAVTWGFNSEKILLQHEPTFIARHPKDLLTICGL